MLYRFIVGLVRIGFSFWFSIKFEGKENIPKNKGCVYASNHRSYADPPLIVLGVKRRFSFMAKEELFEKKFFGGLIARLGAFPVSRGKGDMEVIETAVERLKKGDNLVIFPEGTRSKDGKVGRGKGGAAVIASKARTLIVPVGIVFKDEKLKFRSKIRVVYGKPIDVSEFVTDGEEPAARDLVKLKNRYMAEIKLIVEGEHANE